MIVNAFMSILNWASALKWVNSHRMLQRWGSSSTVFTWNVTWRFEKFFCRIFLLRRFVWRCVMEYLALYGRSSKFFPGLSSVRNEERDDERVHDVHRELSRKFPKTLSGVTPVIWVTICARPVYHKSETTSEFPMWQPTRPMCCHCCCNPPPHPHVIKHPNVRYVKTLIAFRPRQIAGGTNVRYY